MTQEERNEVSLEKIIGAAIREFGAYGYQNSSLNRICRSGNISKGRMYHYFADKTQLFFACSKKVYTELIQYMERYQPEPTATLEQNLHDFFHRRQQFFYENPYYAAITLAVQPQSNPPADENGEFEALMKQSAACNARILQNILQLYSFEKSVDPDIIHETILTACYYVQIRYGFPYWDPESPSPELMEDNINRFDKLIHIICHGIFRA